MRAPLIFAHLSLSLLAPGCVEENTNRLPPRTPESVDWIEIRPGVDTSCARGTPFSFFVRPGNVNRVVIEFEGGGACWDAETCAPGSGLFTEAVERPGWMMGSFAPEGIHDHDDPRNPFAHWHHVYVPYCTGDIHWGDNVVTHRGGTPDAFVIHHRGGVNARAALEWVFSHFEALEKILVSGCSAGAYGSVLWTAHVRNQYPETRIYQIADAGAGVITRQFFQQSYFSWRPQASYPTWLPGVSAEALVELPNLYEVIGRAYPDVRLSAFSAWSDEEQARRYRLMGGSGGLSAWREEMLDSFRTTSATLDNFHFYVGPGRTHCVTPGDAFYTMKSDGRTFVDWIQDLVDDEPLEDVVCRACRGAP